MSSRVAEMETWRIGDTQDAETMFMIGTDVSESCQSVHVSADLNKCVLDYMADAATRAIVVRHRDATPNFLDFQDSQYYIDSSPRTTTLLHVVVSGYSSSLEGPRS